MFYYAKINSDNVVEDVLVTDDGLESRAIKWFTTNLGGTWLRTEMTKEDGSPVIRKNPAIIGGTYDPELDAFIPVKPHNSWVLDTDTCNWVAPVPVPDPLLAWTWDEETTTWIED